MLLHDFEWAIFLFASMLVALDYLWLYSRLRRCRKYPNRVLDLRNLRLFMNLFLMSGISHATIPIILYCLSQDMGILTQAMVHERSFFQDLMIYFLIVIESMYLFIATVVTRNLQVKV